MRGQQLALKTSHNRSIWFRNRLQARYPSSESKSYLSSCLCFKCSDIITVFSSKRKSEVRLNSSISVSGRGGAVCALFGISLGNSNSSSDKYYAFFPLTLDFLIKNVVGSLCNLLFAVILILFTACVVVQIVQLVAWTAYRKLS